MLRIDGFFNGKRNEGMRPPLLDASQGLLAAGQADSALTLATAAEEISAVDSIARTGSAFVGEAKLREAQALLALGRKAEARARAAEALAALRSGAGEDHFRTREAKALAGQLGA